MIKDLWYKNAVVYCLSVGTYMDANADGIGDFQGLMRAGRDSEDHGVLDTAGGVRLPDGRRAFRHQLQGS